MLVGWRYTVSRRTIKYSLVCADPTKGEMGRPLSIMRSSVTLDTNIGSVFDRLMETLTVIRDGLLLDPAGYPSGVSTTGALACITLISVRLSPTAQP